MIIASYIKTYVICTVIITYISGLFTKQIYEMLPKNNKKKIYTLWSSFSNDLTTGLILMKLQLDSNVELRINDIPQILSNTEVLFSVVLTFVGKILINAPN